MPNCNGRALCTQCDRHFTCITCKCADGFPLCMHEGKRCGDCKYHNFCSPQCAAENQKQYECHKCSDRNCGKRSCHFVSLQSSDDEYSDDESSAPAAPASIVAPPEALAEALKHVCEYCKGEWSCEECQCKEYPYCKNPHGDGPCEDCFEKHNFCGQDCAEAYAEQFDDESDGQSDSGAHCGAEG